MDAWVYERAADQELSRTDRMRRFPRDPDMMTWTLRSMIQIALRSFLRTYNGLEVVGRENLPAAESFVMVCNHSSHFDAISLLASLPLRRVHDAFPVAAADYFFSTPLRSLLSAIVVNALPFDRLQHTEASLDVCRELLAGANNVLILFPEGTRSCDGGLGRFRSGVGRLVAGTSTPVVPCHLSGAYEAWPRHRAVPRPRRLRLHIGHPRVFREVSPFERDVVATIAEQLRDDVAALGLAARGQSDTGAAVRDHAASSFGRRSETGRSASISSSE